MNYTSIEQSKKLLELGLSPKSADMLYIKRQSIINPKEWKYDATPSIKEYEFITFSGDTNDIFLPCWSVGALLELMPTSPKSVRISKNCDGNYDLGYRNFDTKEHLYLIDACFEMTVWLLENNTFG